jgi:uridine kinase
MAYLLGIAGGSGSGKGTLADLMKTNLEEWGLTCQVVSTDDFYRDLSHLNERQRDNLCFDPEFNYDHPKSVNFESLMDISLHLKEGLPFSYKTYNFKTHTFDDDSNTIEVPENLDVAIIEGNYALFSDEKSNNWIINGYDHSIFVTTTPEIAVIRRIKRDTEERGRKLEHVLRQLTATVIPMYKKFIYPTHINAIDEVDWHVHTNLNPEIVREKLSSKARQRAMSIYENVKGSLLPTLGKIEINGV